MRELALEIQGVGLTIDRVVQDTVDIRKDVVLSDRRRGAVVSGEPSECPIRDIVEALTVPEAIARDLLVAVHRRPEVKVG